MRKILLVNDDGIDAIGLQKLAEAAIHFGKVWIVAPDSQCSGMSHRITIRQKMKLTQVDYPVPVEAAYKLQGMPADCVKIGIHYILKEKPDWVISGINNGFNLGFDTYYSGTVCAALESIMNGVPAIALSKAYDGNFNFSDYYLKTLLEEKLEEPLENAIWNINFPDYSQNNCKGICYDTTVAPMQLFADNITAYQEPDGLYVAEEGKLLQDKVYPKGSDVRAVRDGYISVGKVYLEKK